MLLICIQKHPWLKTLGATGKPVLCRAENGWFPIMPWSRSQLEMQCWTPTSRWRMVGPLRSSGWRFCGERSWRSCLRWKAQGPAAERWLSAGLWSVGGSLEKWPRECDAAGLWRLAGCVWAPGCALAWTAPAPYAYKLKKKTNRNRERKTLVYKKRPGNINRLSLFIIISYLSLLSNLYTFLIVEKIKSACFSVDFLTSGFCL